MSSDSLPVSTEFTILPISPNMDPPGMELLSFACEIPSEIMHRQHNRNDEISDLESETPLPFSRDSPSNATGGSNNEGIVGTITILAKKSVMIWFGIGKLSDSVAESTNSLRSNEDTTSSIGTARNLSMGPLMVAMPRLHYKGAFSNGEASTSKLVGDDVEDSEILASQMASRLSQRLQIPVFVSCTFDNAPHVAGGPTEYGLLKQRVTALAEREVWQILRTKYNSPETAE